MRHLAEPWYAVSTDRCCAMLLPPASSPTPFEEHHDAHKPCDDELNSPARRIVDEA